jgi:hypothetical protein
LNAYLTPASAIGFAPHYDRHDVFVLQIAGSKAWTFAKTAERQLPNERIARRQNTPLRSLGKGSVHVMLSAGDLLYCPRGIVHKAKATTDYSFHLTIGVRPCNWSQIAVSMIQTCEDADVSLRKAAYAPSDAPPFIKTLSRIVQTDFHIHDPLLEAFKCVRNDLIARMSPLPDVSVDVFASELVTSNSLLQLRTGMKCAVSANAVKVEITFPGLGSEVNPASIEAPKALEEAFRFIAKADRPFRARDLPGAMSNNVKKLVVKRLLGEGLLKITGPRHSTR